MQIYVYNQRGNKTTRGINSHNKKKTWAKTDKEEIIVGWYK
jgi:hypothetical protein